MEQLTSWPQYSVRSPKAPKLPADCNLSWPGLLPVFFSLQVLWPQLSLRDCRLKMHLFRPLRQLVLEP